MGGNKRNAAGIDAWKGDSRLHRNDRLLHRKGFVRATTYSLLKPLDLLALAQPPHDVDGEDAALMTRELSVRDLIVRKSSKAESAGNKRKDSTDVALTNQAIGSPKGVKLSG